MIIRDCLRFLQRNTIVTITAIVATVAPKIHMGKASAGGGGGGGATERTVMVIVSVAVLPAASLTVNVTEYVLGLV